MSDADVKLTLIRRILTQPIPLGAITVRTIDDRIRQVINIIDEETDD